MLRLYDSLVSGNAYKARLMLSVLGLPFERVELDVDRNETRSPAFLAKNPNGRIPLLELGAGDYLAESNAIICYLADGTPYLPGERRARAAVLQWLFFEQYSHEPNIATVRYWLTHQAMTPERAAMVPEKRRLGYAALDVMERHLESRSHFVGERLSVADVALYAYTHVAHEGGFELERYRAIGSWLERIAETPGYIPITQAAGTDVHMVWQ
ncbi:MAG: glutathione S-transferase family protein [Alphaproteobacteria bacterium]